MSTNHSETADAGNTQPPAHTSHGIYAGADYQYIGRWSNGQPHGKGTKQQSDGLMEHGEFFQGVLAMGHRAWPNGDFEDGRFIGGILAAGRRSKAGQLEEGQFITHSLLD